MITISDLPRIINYNGKELKDFPDMDVSEVIKMHSNDYPELIGSDFVYEGINEQGCEVYTFEASAGIKG